MKNRLYIVLFGFSLLLSASLLFAIQPIFSKMILPLLGGSSHVWNTAMLFFQLTLLAGYAYAHATTRWLSVRMQSIIQILLLVGFAALLPVTIAENTEILEGESPTFWQLGLMLTTIGGPFFVLAASAPMIQRWFFETGHPEAHNPYFLYAASNFGSMAALLAYPTLIEPLLSLKQQSISWAYGYGCLILLTIACASLSGVRKHKKHKEEGAKEKITLSQSLTWLGLAAIPSSLMLGVTTFITTDVASVPLLWIIPLALYLGTFIIVFSRKNWISQNTISTIQKTLFICLVPLLMLPAVFGHVLVILALHISLFFVCALVCHKKLADLKPGAANLTAFYLLMSAGGAIGGIFNTIIAPALFVVPIEYPLALIGSLIVFALADKTSFLKSKNALIMSVAFIIGWSLILSFTPSGDFVKQIFTIVVIFGLLLSTIHSWLFIAAITIFMFFFTPGSVNQTEWELIHQDRNFFGVVKIYESENTRHFLHGTTEHGVQSLDESNRLKPLSYYGPDSPIGEIISLYDDNSGEQKIAVLGLGIGTVACFAKENRSFDFFEINPKVIEIAQDPKYFSYLSDCGSPYDIILGDGRLEIAKKPNDFYDIMIMDAFSSDNIPIHTLTIEALEMYMEKLKEDGVLVLHISNRYLDIEPFLALAGEELGIQAYRHMSKVEKIVDDGIKYNASHCVAFTKNEEHLSEITAQGWSKARERDDIKPWTDQYSNIFKAIK